jgi:hypothetical protein
MNHNDGFWEHFSDHLIIAVSFFVMGLLTSIHLIIKIWRVKIDPHLENGEIIRIIDDETGRNWIIGNPKRLVEYCDLLLLAYFYKGKEKHVCVQSLKRIRVVTGIIITIATLIVLSGVILLFSALKADLNIFNYL